MDALRRAITLSGGRVKLAQKLGLHPMAVYQWLVRRRVPPQRCVDIERATDGQVTRHDLRPELFGPAVPSAGLTLDPLLFLKDPNHEGH